MRSLNTALLITLALSTGCAELEFEEETGHTEQPLIGGYATRATDYQATVALWGGSYCTAALVGPRHILTAAHCVASKTADGKRLTANLKARYQTGGRIFINHDNNLAKAGRTWHTVESTLQHPSWVAACTPSCRFNQSLLDNSPPDLAVVILEDEFPADWVQGYVDVDEVYNYDRVTTMGYGCDDFLQSGSGMSTLKHDHPRARAYSPSSTITDGYIMTYGDEIAGSNTSSLCYGDSGGPVYRGTSHSSPAIVGVNAYYMFPQNDPDNDSDGADNGVSLYNFHTRLGNDNATHDVAGWLDDVLPAGSVRGAG